MTAAETDVLAVCSSMDCHIGVIEHEVKNASWNATLLDPDGCMVSQGKERRGKDGHQISLGCWLIKRHSSDRGYFPEEKMSASF